MEGIQKKSDKNNKKVKSYRERLEKLGLTAFSNYGRYLFNISLQTGNLLSH